MQQQSDRPSLRAIILVNLQDKKPRLVRYPLIGTSQSMALEINNEYFENQQDVLKALTAVDSNFHKRLRELIYQELKASRNAIAEGIKFNNGDPRGTRHSVKRYIAGKYLGGVVSIMDGKRSGTTNNYEAPRKLRAGQWGGNRIIRSQRTHDILHYGPQDRGFILRFVNSGTAPRYAAGRNVSGKGNRSAFFKMQKEGDWYRGSIAPRDFFATLGRPEMERAVRNLGQMVDEEFNKLFTE